MLIDTHCHLNLMVKNPFDVPLTHSEILAAETIIQEASAAGVTRIINVGTNLVESKNSIALAQQYTHVYASVGIHPNDLHAQWRDDFAHIEQLITQHRPDDPFGTRPIVVALGETGLDFFRSPENAQQQVDAFKAHIECALKHDLAVVVHSRNAPQETLRVLEEYVPNNLRAVIHCFSYDLEFAGQAINWGMYLGIGATITYPKNEILRDVVRTVPLLSIVLETDAPFLPPQALRGKQNSPQHIRTVAHYIADLRQTTVELIAEETTGNAFSLFKIGQQ